MKSMKQLAPILLFLLPSMVQAQLRHLKVIQDGVEMPRVGDTIFMNKSGFAFAFDLKDNDVVHINVSYDVANYQQADKASAYDKMDCFAPGKGMSDYPSNSEKTLLIKHLDHGYWGHIGMRNRTNFDLEEVHNDTITATRTVEKINILDAKFKGSYEVQTLPVNVLYVVYTTYYDTPKGKRESTDLYRLVLVFRD